MSIATGNGVILGPPFSFRRFLVGVGVPILGALVLAVYGCTWLAGRSCIETGRAIGLETQWGTWTGCLGSVNGQLLPWSEIVPVERNGKIVFVPKPYVRLSTLQNQ